MKDCLEDIAGILRKKDQIHTKSLLKSYYDDEEIDFDKFMIKLRNLIHPQVEDEETVELEKCLQGIRQIVQEDQNTEPLGPHHASLKGLYELNEEIIKIRILRRKTLINEFFPSNYLQEGIRIEEKSEMPIVKVNFQLSYVST